MRGKKLNREEMWKRAKAGKPKDTTTPAYQRWYRACVALGLPTKDDSPSQSKLIERNTK